MAAGNHLRSQRGSASRQRRNDNINNTQSRQARQLLGNVNLIARRNAIFKDVINDLAQRGRWILPRLEILAYYREVKAHIHNRALRSRNSDLEFRARAYALYSNHIMRYIHSSRNDDRELVNKFIKNTHVCQQLVADPSQTQQEQLWVQWKRGLRLTEFRQLSMDGFYFER